MKSTLAVNHPIDLDSIIVTVRGQKVILDSDLARIYGVPTFRFNEAVKRNQHRFPSDFRFQLTGEEWAAVQPLRSQNAILDTGPGSNSSQIAMSSARHRGAAYRPWAFTEHGAMMAANILNSDRAVEMSVYVIRAFVKMRAELAKHHDLARRLAEIERTLIGHDTALRDLYNKIRPLLLPGPPKPLLDAFPKQVEPLHQRVVSNRRESRTLAALRDALPRMLSGLSGELRLPACGAKAGVKNPETLVAAAKI